MTKEIKLTQGKVALVDDGDYEYLNQWKWCVLKRRKTWYAVRRGLLPNKTFNLIYMHREVLQPKNGKEVDHINTNGLDNRRENLREATPSENRCNRGKTIDNKLGWKGVHKLGKCCYVAEIGGHGVHKHLGVFTNPIEAAHAYDNAAKLLHGKFAYLNFPDE